MCKIIIKYDNMIKQVEGIECLVHNDKLTIYMIIEMARFKICDLELIENHKIITTRIIEFINNDQVVDFDLIEKRWGKKLLEN